MRASKLTLLLVVLVAVVLLCGYETGDRVDLTLSVEADLVYNNSVGDDWVTDFWVEYNGKSYSCDDGESISFRYTTGDEFSIHSYVKESDSYPDTAGYTSYESITIGNELSKYYRSFTHTLTVVEDRGRYAGNTAQWEIKFSFTAEPEQTSHPTQLTNPPTQTVDFLKTQPPEPTLYIDSVEHIDTSSQNKTSNTDIGLYWIYFFGALILVGIIARITTLVRETKERREERKRLKADNRRIEREINEIIKILPIYDKLKVLEYLEHLYKK